MKSIKIRQALLNTKYQALLNTKYQALLNTKYQALLNTKYQALLNTKYQALLNTKYQALLISLVFFVFYSYLSLKLYDAHLTRGDLTSYAQAMWNTSQGRIMQNTFNYSVHNFWGDRNLIIPDDSNIFGIHFNLILFILVPFYYIFPDPKTLLIIQAFFVTQSGFVYALIARRLVKSRLLILTLKLSFLLYLPLVSTVLSEFHAVSLSIFLGYY